jgi:hypothetical protein
MAHERVNEAADLIRLEYLEMPGMKLTSEQARRLWNLPQDLCQQALDDLLADRFLARTRHGAYVRDLGGER